MKFSFMHLADTHLGYRQYGQKERFNDFARAASWAIEEARARQVDFVVLAGDTFHKRSTVQPRTLEQAYYMLEQLQKAGIPCLAIEGNHDRPFYLDTEASWVGFLAQRGLVQLLNFIPGEQDSLLPACPAGQYGEPLPGVLVFGMGFKGAGTRAALTDLTRAIRAFRATRDVEYAILLMHTGMSGQLPQEMTSALNRAELEDLRSCIDYVALGHYHKPFTLENWIYNPGSPELTDLALLNHPGGIQWVEVDTRTAAKHTATHLISPKRPWIRERFDVGADDTPAALLGRLDSVLRTRHAQTQAGNGERAPIVHLILKGRFNFDAHQLDLDPIHELVTSIFQPLECKIHVQAISATGPDLDPGQSLSRQALEHAVMQEMMRNHSEFGSHTKHWLAAVHEIMELALAPSQPDTDTHGTIYDVLSRYDAGPPDYDGEK